MTKEGGHKLVERCTYPLTGRGVVNRIYSDLAVIEVTPAGFRLVELAPGVDLDTLARHTGAPVLPPAR